MGTRATHETITRTEQRQVNIDHPRFSSSAMIRAAWGLSEPPAGGALETVALSKKRRFANLGRSVRQRLRGSRLTSARESYP
jgi:hypothetical protein